MPQVVSSDGVAIVYDDLGPRDGVPVVLCHGLGAAGEQLLADGAFFAARGYRVLVPDLRGHGRSGKPVPMAGTAFSIPRLAEDLVAMLEQAAVAAVHWVGNSLGGILALHLLADHEARFRTLATFGTAYALHLPRWVGATVPASYRMLGAGLTATLTALGTTRSKAARPMIAKLIRQFDPEVGRLVVASLADYDLTAHAVAARLPILLLRGGHDSPVNAALKPALAAMAGRRNFTLIELPEAGHCANLDATAAWRTALLGFWAGR